MDNLRETMVGYVRKSTDTDNKQVQSIESQIDYINKIVEENGYELLKIFEDRISAKEPRKRPEFIKMLEFIEQHKPNAIITWHLDRLSRNSVDSGSIIYLLEKEYVQKIITNTQIFSKSDAGLMSYVMFGMAAQYRMDLGKNARRGMDTKRSNGWYPGKPPIGYLNGKDSDGQSIIIVDTERYDKVRRLWELMLTGCYSLDKIMKIANDDLHIRTRPTKKKVISKNQGRLHRSNLEKLFKNIFYAGILVDKKTGEEFVGKHKPMITREEFDAVQSILHGKRKNRGSKHSFPYTSLIKCGECNSMITAETKYKLIKSEEQLREYVYYHCTKRALGSENCTQKSIIADDLEKQILMILEGISMPKEIVEWGVGILKENHKLELTTTESIINQNLIEIDNIRKYQSQLLDLLLKQKITENEYRRKSNEFKDMTSEINKSIERIKKESESWLEPTIDTFELSTHAKSIIENGSNNDKKQLLRLLTSSMVLKDNILNCEFKPWITPIQEAVRVLNKANLRLEPTIYPENDNLEQFSEFWLGSRDSNPDNMIQSHASCHWTTPQDLAAVRGIEPRFHG